jgi:hypothetical protein
MSPAAYNAVNEGDVGVIWDVKLADTSPEGSTDSADEVLAFEKQVPTEGGEVLMKNRTVKKMTADELKAAKEGEQRLTQRRPDPAMPRILDRTEAASMVSRSFSCYDLDDTIVGRGPNR